MQADNERKVHGVLRWIHEHLQITGEQSFDRGPLPDKGEHVVRRGRKATGQSWALIAGLPKDRVVKGNRLRQAIPGDLT